MTCLVCGISAKGERPAAVGPMGELTEVASAKRAVRGVLIDSPSEEQEELRDRTETFACFFSSSSIGFSKSLSIEYAGTLLCGSFDITLGLRLT